MDIWEANSRSFHVAPHTCNQTGLYLCEGVECEYEGVCDKNGCAWNPYRVNITNYYGNSDQFKVDTRRPFTVITQFPAGADGKLKEIRRMYVQEGKLVESYTVEAAGLPKVNALNDEFCIATGAERYLDLGGTGGMGDALTRGMVLVGFTSPTLFAHGSVADHLLYKAMSIWWSEGDNMQWLDGGAAGPCNATEGNPSNVVKVQPEPEVTFSNMRWGEIGSTFKTGVKCRKQRV